MSSRKGLHQVASIQDARALATSDASKVLKRIRTEWEEASQGESLLDTFSPVGLLLWDVIKGLNLPQADAMDVLGFDLWAECKHLADRGYIADQDEWLPAYPDGQ